MSALFSHENVDVNGVRLHVVSAGPKDGPLVVLLHGFPEFWYGWKHQISYLASLGFRVLAPDQRGYNLSDKPDGIASYNLDKLVGDVVGLIRAQGREKARIVGHDWGAAVAWWTAITRPDVVERLVILNVPHPQIMQRTMRTSLKQLRKSWYIAFFQLPWLPETGLAVRNFFMGTRALRESSRPGTFSDADLAEYRKAWSQPGALRSMVHWYRAMLRHAPAKPPGGRVRAPTLLIWGSEDKFLGREMAGPSAAMCEQGRVEFIEGASHWVQHEEPARVNSLLREFLAAN